MPEKEPTIPLPEPQDNEPPDEESEWLEGGVDILLQEATLYWEKVQAIDRKWVTKDIGGEPIAIALQTTDYNTLARLALLCNALVKNHDSTQNRLVEFLYKFKELILAKAFMYAYQDAPADSWGLGKDNRNQFAVFFDLPGYKQVSFHVPNRLKNVITRSSHVDPEHLTPLEKIYYDLQVPQYAGEWEKTYQPSDRTSASEALRLWNKRREALTLGKLRREVESGSLGPRDRHRLYCKAMAHPNFARNKEEVRRILFPDTPTIPGAFPSSYVHGTVDIKGINENSDVSPTDKKYFRDKYDAYDFQIFYQYLDELETLADQGLTGKDQEEIIQSILGPVQFMTRRFMNTSHNRERKIKFLRRVDDLLTAYGIPLPDFYSRKDEDIRRRLGLSNENP
jgi:hypothetical protein